MKINKLNKIKTNNYGFGHMEIILVVLVVAIIGVVGFTVFNNHKTSSSLKATAGGWSHLYSAHGVSVSGCTALWGNLREVKIAYTKSPNVPAYWYDSKLTNGAPNPYTETDAGWSNAYWAGAISVQTLYVDNRLLGFEAVSSMQATANRYYPENRILRWAQC